MLQFVEPYSRTLFHMARKEGQFDVVVLIVYNQFKAFCISFNAQNMNGKTHFLETEFHNK